MFLSYINQEVYTNFETVPHFHIWLWEHINKTLFYSVLLVSSKYNCNRCTLSRLAHQSNLCIMEFGTVLYNRKAQTSSTGFP